jgi:putative transposase
MEKAYRYRLFPTVQQESLLRKTLGCVRLVYNKALAARTEAWYERKERVGYNKSSSMLTSWKQESDLEFLNEVSCVPLQQGLRHLQKAFTNFWAGRAKYPNFKKKHQGGSAEFTKSAFRWKDGQVFLAKCSEPLPIRWSRPIPEGCIPSTITVKLDASGRWFVSLLVDTNIAQLPKSDKSIGLDVGMTSWIATSNGEKIASPKHVKRLRRKLKRVQKALSRKQKGSNNRHKAQRQVAKVHAQITDARKDFLQKLTTQLVRENQTIVVEDLPIKNRVLNPKLALSMSDASWGELIRQLAYKCQWYGRELIKIERRFPSAKRCGNCGHIFNKMSLNISEWECPQCRVNHDRDINASKNILAAGLAVSVCGATVRAEESKSRKPGAMKQKPK